MVSVALTLLFIGVNRHSSVVGKHWDNILSCEEREVHTAERFCSMLLLAAPVPAVVFTFASSSRATVCFRPNHLLLLLLLLHSTKSTCNSVRESPKVPCWCEILRTLCSWSREGNSVCKRNSRGISFNFRFRFRFLPPQKKKSCHEVSGQKRV